MRMNEDGKTVRAMDVLAPGIGEIMGGSQREERLDVLEQRIRDMDQGTLLYLIFFISPLPPSGLASLIPPPHPATRWIFCSSVNKCLKKKTTASRCCSFYIHQCNHLVLIRI